MEKHLESKHTFIPGYSWQKSARNRYNLASMIQKVKILVQEEFYESCKSHIAWQS
jgi:hypothetical protein